VTDIKDVFGRINPKVMWTDVPKEHYDKLMSMSEKDRNSTLKKIEDSIDIDAVVEKNRLSKRTEENNGKT